MNNFERKLAAQPFCEPPAGLRAQILRECETETAWSWRDWLWPSPQAWAALAALWLVLAALEFATTNSGPGLSKAAAEPEAFRIHRDFGALLLSQL